MIFDLNGGGRVLVRPSGTEPKLKIYVDARASVDPTCDPVELERDLMNQARESAEDMVRFLGFDEET